MTRTCSNPSSRVGSNLVQTEKKKVVAGGVAGRERSGGGKKKDKQQQQELKGQPFLPLETAER